MTKTTPPPTAYNSWQTPIAYNHPMRIPESIPLDTEGQYCISCFKGPVERMVNDGRMSYICKSCGKLEDRSLVIDNGVTWWVTENRTYWHESVGVVVVNKENKILCIMRQIFPFAYALPAGHLDKDEKPEHAARRELKEETSIVVEGTLEHLGDFDIPGDSCRRGSDDHIWHLYRYRLPNDSKIVLSDEASRAEWFTLSELQNLDNATYPLLVIVQMYNRALVD